MDPLGGVSPVMEILRRQMTENLEKLRRSGGADAPSRPMPPLGGLPLKPGLRQTLARRVGSLGARDPQFQEKATALLVESILTAEFGESLVNDGGFRLMIRDVARAMSAEPAVAADLAQLFRELAAPAD